jgi:4-hydroxyphenylpyruvate dioxygenase
MRNTSVLMADTNNTDMAFESGQSLRFNGIDYIEMYVGNAFQGAHYYRSAFGYTPIAYAGPETGERDRASFAMQQNGIRFALTSALNSHSEIAKHVHHHGDGVKDIALTVDDAAGAFSDAVNRGARPILEPTVFEDESGQVIKATIATLGDTVHSFIQRDTYDGPFFPKYKPIKSSLSSPQVGLTAIDHIALVVEPRMVDSFVKYYQSLAFQQVRAEDISSEYSAMNTRVVQDATGQIIFVLVEPLSSNRKSPIDEYLLYHEGAGVHHIALSSNDIVKSVRMLLDNGVDFASTPSTYYENLERRVGKIAENKNDLSDLGILVDRDSYGYLMQIFCKPVQGRPTSFFEVIQRVGARGFGSGNIKALYESIELEQIRRGNI